ncbi:MAG: OmpA family protein [Gammaproteobacteria bacterium]
MKLKTLGTLILCAASTQVFADKEYWLGTDGDYARGRDGKCVRTILWTPEAAIPGCEGVEAKAEVKPGQAKEEPVAAKEVVEPKYTNLSLASGATFELGGNTLSVEGKAEIVAMMGKFEAENVKSVEIAGYTDDSGDASFNQQLSEKRAEAVKAELVANGANSDKITTVGYGEASPIADNSTREGRAKNRRVEIKVEGTEQQL